MPWTRPQVDLHAGGAEAMDQYNIDDHHYEGSLFPTSTLIPVTVICILIFIIGVTGNTMTILIIQHFKDMKTTTNLYLSSMAVSDLIIFLCLPFDLYRLWKYVPWLFGEAVCRFYHYIFEGCTSATILHITALSIERYLAISFPLRSKVVLTRRRVQYIILALWGFALVSAAPTLFLVGVEYDNDTHPDYNTGQCKHTNYAISSGQLHIMLWVSTTYFFCPMLCLIFLYGSIGCKLWKSKNDMQGPCALARERSHRQTVKILGEWVVFSSLQTDVCLFYVDVRQQSGHIVVKHVENTPKPLPFLVQCKGCISGNRFVHLDRQLVQHCDPTFHIRNVQVNLYIMIITKTDISHYPE